MFSCSFADAQSGVPSNGGMGSVPPGEYNKATRSPADEALPNPYARSETFFKLPSDARTWRSERHRYRQGWQIYLGGGSLWQIQTWPRCLYRIALSACDEIRWRWQTRASFRRRLDRLSPWHLCRSRWQHLDRGSSIKSGTARNEDQRATIGRAPRKYT